MQIFDIMWAKLFSIDFKVDISVPFIRCADTQLAPLFLKETGIIPDGHVICLHWEPEVKFEYKKGEVSSLKSWIAFRYGSVPVTIYWRSKSGKIYDMADTDIDCADIEFWLEDLDVEKCKHFTNPQWSLITFPASYIGLFERMHKVLLSYSFVNCLNSQLTPLFKSRTGLKFSKHLSLVPAWLDQLIYHKGDISSFTGDIYVNHNWNSITILWKSKSGRIYDVGDADIDCSDIEFWFEGLDPVLYHKQMFPNAELPFQLKNLSYELVITRLNMECTIEMQLKKEELVNAEALCKKIDAFIDKFNTQSEKNNREEGVVHNWKKRVEEDKLVYEIDTGFAGPAFLKKLLPFLSKLNCFTRLEVL